MAERSYRTLEGELNAAGASFAIVVSRFNSFITERLLEGAIDAIRRSGGDVSKVDVARVPGSVELATAAKTMAESGKYDAVICLGAIIRGETDHYDHVAGAAASGVAAIGPATGVPTVFGVLTCDTLEQAINRAGAKSGNAGFSGAMTAIEMASLVKKLRSA
ncbi:MAG: 6,7-dimethyl-8-ribityllumazine synthase [Bryobacterales bacterium]|nr:6,7-dimethyl-8-ribityllumazine synthase [Acidobacteriota bacterium]MCB9383927.1 6,7-dimethyl-8-ribityllumazine synthase [Bryobacterales bacterium]